ncbi:hypothetical protein WH95_11800 [Kiloniella litopenaei]|uniref:protein O-GlcNAc transferase n=1 Tax=Kiloniella litopenaei TaxID=1549748 RepID=A0A0M2R7W2_9PROT|nr:hypothetical protein [Kiloniella litopenaei]KKJ76499.1 hypothetical protein WH95_11800 [Kiloniella litopenaei]
MKQGKKFNYKVEKAAEDTLQYLMNRQFDNASEIAAKNLKKKHKHPVFLFVKSVDSLLQGDEVSFRSQLDALFKLPSIRYTDYYNFGVFFQQHKLDVLAVECFSACVQLKQDFFEGQEQLGNSIFNLGEYESALGAYSAALKLKPKSKELIISAGKCCSKLGHYSDGLDYYESLLFEHPFDSDVRTGYASCLIGLDREAEAVAFLGKDIDKSYKAEKDYYLLSLVSYNNSKLHSALKFAAKGHEINPDYLPVLKMYGTCLGRLNIHGLAIDILKKAIEKDPNDPEVLYNCGNSFQGIGEIDQAREYYMECLRINPEYYLAFNNLGFGYNYQGDIKKAKECYGIALELTPKREDFHSNLLFTILHEKDSSPEDHLREARVWQDKHAIPVDERVKEYKFNPAEVKKLRIGYISGDFGDHVAAYYWLPIAEHHDRDKFDIFLYSQKPREDELSQKVNAKIDTICDKKRDVFNLSDEELCKQIVDDQIHILVDLSGHTGGNRLRALTYKPAPVQATYIGYPATTGLETIDYFITQPIHTPIESAKYFSEKLVHTPGCTSYNIRDAGRNVQSKPLPYKKNGYVTFGSFNRPSKISDACIDTWVDVISGVPNSRLIIKSSGTAGDEFKDKIIGRMKAQGISADRIDFRGRSSYEDFLEEINEIDIGLDSFPYTGATTSFDALFMGRSYITLRGTGAVHAIVGATYLEYFGHPEFVAHSTDEYVKIAINAAKNMSQLEDIRLKLRDTFLREIAGSGPRLCAALETAYQKMWDVYISGEEKDHIVIE